MRIIKVVIKKLFGLFDHEIPFNFDDRITIIHGPNGVGKTTILKLIDDLFSKRFVGVRAAPYDMLLIYFDPECTLSVQKRPSEETSPRSNLVFHLKKGRKEHEYTFNPLVEIRNFQRYMPYSEIDTHVDSLERVGPKEWLDESTGEVLSLAEVIYRYSDILPIDVSKIGFDFPEWLRNVLDSIDTHFIQTQRLFVVPPTDTGSRELHYRRHRRSIETQATVERYSADMVNQIQETQRQSGVLASSLDRIFPQKLIKSTLPRSATEKRILKEYAELTEYRNRLMKAGLFDAQEQVALPKKRLSESERKVLWYYLRDVDKKLNIFNELLSKVELFSNIINTRFLYKNFIVDKEKGFVFISTSEQEVPLRALSSGEQHELVLAYELLFRVQQKSLILIDEPELSLHVTWQHKFLEDIKRISDLADLDFLIATHSPSIVHDRSDLMVALGGAE